MNRVLLTTVAIGLGAMLSMVAGVPGMKDGTFTVPHIPWAVPLSGGPIKAFIIVPTNGARDVWDLAGSLGMEPTVFTVQDAAGRFGGRAVFGSVSVQYWGLSYETQLETARNLLDRQQYDLIILANVCMSSLPPEIAYKVSAQVTAGAGLVQTNATIGDPLLESLYTREPVGGDAIDFLRPLPFDALEAAVPWQEGQSSVAALTPAKPYDLHGKFKAYTVKQGRFISLPFPFEGVSWGAYAAVPALIPGICVNMANRWQEDYHYATVAKACLWAAKRDPVVKISAISPQGEVLAIGQSPKVTVTLAGALGFSGRLECEFRDAFTNEVVGTAVREVETKEPESTIVFVASVVPTAKTFVVVRLLDAKGEVVDFGGGFVCPRSEIPLVLKLEKETFNVPEEVVGVIELPTDAQACAVDLMLYDSHGRIWEKRTVEAKPGMTRFALPSRRSPMIVHGLRAVATVEGAPIAAADIFFTLRPPREPYYVSVSDEPWPTWHTLRRFERIYEWGGDGIRNHKPSVNEAIATALAGCDMNPGRPHVPGPDALDPQFVSGLEETGRKSSALYRPFNQAMYNTSDDCGPNAGFVPTAFPRFVEHLRERYVDVKALNAEWGTAFKDFAEIPPELVAESCGKGLVPVWSDYLLFVSQSYLAAQARYRDAIQSVDPDAASGCDAVYYDCSLTSLYRQLGYIMPYYSPLAVEVARSLAKARPPVYTGICTGVYAYYNGTQPYCRMMPWHILLSGNNSILFWSLLCGFEGDLSEGNAQLIGWMMDEIGRIKLSGAAQWLLSAKRAPASVAILYSEASRRAETCGSVFSLLEISALAFQELLEDQGLQYDYVSMESIVEDKALEAPGLKLLILPRSVALSRAEVDAIKRFADAGGAVWADTEPAVMNEHGRRLVQGQLDELFGISQAKPAKKREIKLTFPGQEPLSASADASVAVVGSEALLTIEGTPIFIRGGKGKTLLFNVDPAFFGAGRGGNKEVGSVGRSRPGAMASHAFLGERLAEAGVIPTRCASLAGGPPLGLELTEYSHGDGTLLALEVKPVDGQEYPAAVRLPLGGFYCVYELRSGKRWPASESLDLSVSPNDVYVFSLLTEDPAPLRLEVPERVAPGGDVVATARNSNSPKSTVLVFSLTDPEGVVRRDDQRRISTENGEASCEIALPWNAACGVWTLEAKDVLTGQSVRKDVLVKGP